MHSTGDTTSCHICGELATVCLLDTLSGDERNCCRDHRPDRDVSVTSRRWVIKRWRMQPGGPISQQLAAPRESPEHESVRWDMCDGGLLGGEGACRYYLSMITGLDPGPALTNGLFR
jgi:hypothetical protein